MIVDPRAAERIGAAWLVEALAPAGGYGRRAAEARARFGPGDEVIATAAIAQIVAWARDVSAEGTTSLRAVMRRIPDCAGIVARARAGDVLDDVDCYELGRFADAAAELRTAWCDAGGAEAEAPPPAATLAAVLAPGRTGSGTFYLADGFDPELAQRRAACTAADAVVDDARRAAAVRAGATLGFVPDGEEFVVMRDVLAELPPSVRIVRETPAYRLCRLEPDAAGAAAELAAEAAAAELREVEDGVRRRLSAAVAALAGEISATMRAIGERDCALSRIALAQRFGGCVPTFAGDRLLLEAAIFAPLADDLARAGRHYTPLDCDLDRVTIVTGPNMGGKSAVLATCGFVALCVAHGAPPPARAAALPLFAAVAWIGSDDPGDRARLLSSFGGEVVHARAVLATTMRPQLVLVDEFARSTGPREGRALLVALVEALGRNGAWSLVATHFDRVAEDAGVAHVAIAGLPPGALDGVVSGDVARALDAVNAAMEYRLVAASDTTDAHSDALALARVLGLDEAIVERARALYARA